MGRPTPRAVGGAARHPTEGELSTMAYYRPAWAPDAIDLETPSAARMYDYYLGR
jgi:hypothetical protein